MMTGRVENCHALLPVTFRLIGQPDMSIEFVTDTGFTEELSLPQAAVFAMALPFEYNLTVNLADDSDVEVAVHSATVLWHDSERDVRVFATGRRPLLGTALMDGDELLVQFANNGLMTLDNMQTP